MTDPRNTKDETGARALICLLAPFLIGRRHVAVNTALLSLLTGAALSSKSTIQQVVHLRMAFVSAIGVLDDEIKGHLTKVSQGDAEVECGAVALILDSNGDVTRVPTEQLAEILDGSEDTPDLPSVAVPGGSNMH